MIKRKLGQPRHWILRADPTKYSILDAIYQRDLDWWPVKDIHDFVDQDHVAIWKTRGGKGARRGIIALGRVTGQAGLRADADNPFHLDRDRARDEVHRVPISYIPLSRPLWDDGAHGSLISSLAAARARRGTVFTLRSEQWLALQAAASDADGADEEALFTAIERKRYRLHRRIERDAKIPTKVKRLRRYSCEACGFTFEDMYGDLGSEFIEVHHKRPLASLDEDAEVEYGIDEFAVLCSNCHRMIHRWPDPTDVEGFAMALKSRWHGSL